MADPAEQRLAALRKRWEEDRSSGAFVPLAEEYRRLGRLNEAISVLEQGMKAAPNYLSARIALGRCRLDLGDATGACTILEQVLHQDPTQLVASKLLVEAYLRSRRPEQARERLNLYAVLNDRDPELEELRRRVQQGIRERDQVAVAEPEVPSTPVREALPAAPVAVRPEPVVAPAPLVAPPPEAFAAAPPPLAPPPAVTVTRGSGDVFQLPAVPVPAPDFGRMAALPPPPPLPRGTVFSGLGTPADRRRYVAALLHGGVFGQPFAAEAATVPPSAVEEFSWDSVALEPEPEPVVETEEAMAPVVEVAPAPEFSELVAFAPPVEELLPEEPAAEPPVAVAEPALEAFPFAAVGEPELAAAEADFPLEAPAPPPAEEIQPTATLGELYLSQGHRQEAQTIFERVLEVQPDNPAAREGLESVRRQAEPAGRQGVTARKVALLQDFLKRVRGGSDHHVS